MNENKTAKPVREPLFHITKRATISRKKALLIRAVAFVAALLFVTLLCFFLMGANPIKLLTTLVSGSFGTSRRIWTLAKELAKLLCIALAVTPAFRMRFWNLGADGQVLIGALASVACVHYLGNTLPNAVLLIVMFVAAILAGGIWGVLPALFKAKWNTNESLFNLMMNYIATYLVSFALIKWTPNGSSSLGRLPSGHLPVIVNDYLLLILVVLTLTFVMHLYLNYSKQGYEISVVGESENTARYVGINVGKVVVRTMLLSGALCGLAGFLIVAALDHTITIYTVGGIGFTAIMVSWLAKFNPIVMIFTSFLIAFLQRGSDRISTVFNVSSAIPDLIVGVILFFIIGCEFFINYEIKFRNKAKGGSAV